MFSQSISLTFLLIALRLGAITSAKTVPFVFNIKNENLSPDGFTRSAVTANGLLPGPLISANKGDRFLIDVIDELTDSSMRRATSIHWHGIFQAHTAEMDGPAFVTQCPIVPGHAFTYDFSTPGQSGTYWYHSHLSTQYCDGLRGPLVLYDPNDPLKYLYDIDDESTIITLMDWYHQPAPSLFPNPTNATPSADSTLINGLGRWSGSSTPGPLAVIRAHPGKRHRYRLISASCDPSFDFSIDGHNMTIIEADGVEVQPYTVQKLTIFASQRYSFILQANQPVGNYWIRALPSLGGATFNGGINSAILRYDGAPNAEPNTTAQVNPIVMNEANLHPLINPGAPGKHVAGGADMTLQLNITRPGDIWEINGAQFNPPSVPVLLQILSGQFDAHQLLPNGSVYGLPPNKVIEITIPGGFPHPFHLHGHNFDVIRVSGQSDFNFVNPVRRDTVSIGGATDLVTFRFETNNPGPWFLHCHIDWHLDGGLAVVMAEDAKDIKLSDPPSLAWDALCPLYNQLNPDKQFG